MTSKYEVKDIKLADEGCLLLQWAEDHMPVLMKIRDRFQEEKPLRGVTLAACLHVTKETGVLARTLRAGGAEVALCASNPLSTTDEVAAALADEGIHVFAWRGQTPEEYYRGIENVLKYAPSITMDDGADLVTTLHTKRQALLSNVLGGTEETTTGVIRLRAMAGKGDLKYPIIAVNDAYTKYLFDNRYGTGQSTLDGILRATSVLLAGKTFVVAGYGWCGRGLALRARGMGSSVVITEVNPLKALEALMDGFAVMPMDKAAEIGDIFVTVTGDINVITGRHMLKMRDRVILANSGHFNIELAINDLEELAIGKKKIRENVEEYTLKNEKHLYLLAEGRLVNLAAAEGHPSEVMDMSFANQSLSAEYIKKHGRELKTEVYGVPEDIDSSVAKYKLDSMRIQIDSLTEEQKKYLSSWEIGTI